jgi:hypothetical protein
MQPTTPLAGRERDEDMPDRQTIPISALSPSAARLLLALVTSNENEEMDAVIMRAGIGTWKTFLHAKQQLLEGRYLFVVDGKQYATAQPK